MKRAAKILCIAVFITSLLTGFCSATPINENYNFLLDGDVWAVLNLQATESSGVWSYAYTLTNYLDLHPIHQLLLPVVTGGYSGLAQAGSGVGWSSAGDDGWGTLVINYAGITKDQSSKAVLFESIYSPAEGFATIINGGASSETVSKSAIGATGGGNNTVPEPATMLLLGIGILGAGAYRYVKSVKRP